MKQLTTLIMTLTFLFGDAQDKDEYYKRAIDFKNHKDYKNAILQVDLALELDSTNFDYFFLKANCFDELNQYQLAFNTYSKLIKLYPDNAIAYNERGLLLNSIQESELSIQDFTTALNLNNTDSLKVSLLVNRGASKISIRDFKGAYDDFISAYQIDSLQIGTLNNLATVCDEVGKGDQTLKYLYKILAIDSTFIGAYGNIGFKYQEMGNYKKAIEFFNKVLTLDPNEPLAYSNRSYNRYKVGDLTGALSDIDKSISLYPNNSYAYRNRALVFIELKKTNNVCSDLKKAIDLGFTKMYGKEVEQLMVKYCLKKGSVI